MSAIRTAGLLLGAALPALALDVIDLSTAPQWFGPIRDHPALKLSGSFGWETPGHDREDGDASLARSGGGALAAGRVLRTERTEAWLRVAAVDIRQDSTVVLPDSHATLPDRLQDVRIGGFWRTASEDGRTAFGLDAESSSPSDVPYSGSETLAFSATAFASLPAGERDAWILALRYDSSRSFLPNVPLPGVSYRFDRSPDWTLTVGLPFLQGDVRLVPEVRLAATWALVDTFTTALSWTPGQDQKPFLAPWTLSLGASQITETWLRADRPDEDQRLVYRTIRVYTAAEWQPFPGNRLRVAGGLIPRRTVQETDDTGFGGSSDNRVVLGRSWFTSVGLRLAY